MPSIDVTVERRDRVAVAVNAIILTSFGIRLRTSPILNKVSRKVSPLYISMGVAQYKLAMNYFHTISLHSEPHPQ